MVIVSPIFHGTGLATYLVGAALGNKVVTTRRFKPEGTLQLIADHEADMLVAVPTMLHRIVELAPDVIAQYDTSSLKVIVIAGSALTPELSNRVQDTFGDVLYNIYASTECGFATIATPDELRIAPGTAGRSPVNSEMVLFDEHDRRVDGANKRGRIFVRSAARFEGYTDGRNKQIIDGYMSSGDMGHFDENGLLFVDGRDDDMIVSGGENVFPQEVENLLVERHDVSDAAVVGVDDAEFGKRLRAFVVLKPGAQQNAEQIKLYVKDNLARHKVPRDVVFIDELPRNATGKLLRRVLVEMDVDTLGDDVDQPARDHDHLLRRRAGEERLHLLVGQRRGLQRVGVGVGGHRDAAADLAVDLHRVLDGVLDEVLRVGHRERPVRQRGVVAQPLPQLLGQVRRQRRDHQHQRLHRRPRRHTLLGQVVGVLDQLGRGGVVAQVA